MALAGAWGSRAPLAHLPVTNKYIKTFIRIPSILFLPQGYALVEFGKRSEAERAIKEMDGETLYDKEIRVDWAFVNRESICFLWGRLIYTL